MAEQITRTLIDDMDGSKASETVRFSYDGALYEIDLSKRNLAAFQKVFTPFVTHARKLPRAPRQSINGQHGGSARTAAQKARSADIRAWARSQGMAVSERGRIPASVIEQYAAR